MIRGSYREAGALGKWVDKTLAKCLQEINIEWPIDEMGDTHVVKDVIQITCNDVWRGSRLVRERKKGGGGGEDDSTRTSMVTVGIVHGHLSIAVACI